MKCAHCHAPNAEHRWSPQLCADGRRKRSKRLCDVCDEALNRLVLEFFNDPMAGEKMAGYVEGRA